MSWPGKRCRRKCPDLAEADSLRFNELEYAGFLSPLDHASMRRPPLKTMPNSPLPLKRRRSGWSGSASQTRDEWLGNVCVNEWKPQFASMSSMTAVPPGRSVPQATRSEHCVHYASCHAGRDQSALAHAVVPAGAFCLTLGCMTTDRGGDLQPLHRLVVGARDWWAEDRCSRDDPFRCTPSLQE